MTNTLRSVGVAAAFAVASFMSGQAGAMPAGGPGTAALEQIGVVEQARIEVDENSLKRCVHGELVYEPDIEKLPFPFPKRLAGDGLA